MTWIAVGVAGLAAGTVTTIAGVQAGISKHNQKVAERNRPNYNIPSYYGKNLTLANQQLLNGMDSQTQRHWQNSIDRNAANNYAGFSDLNAGVRGVSATQSQVDDAQSAFEAANGQVKMQGRQMVMGANKDLADQEALAYQLNVLNPYYESIARKKARNDAFFSSAMSAAGMFGGAAMGASKGGGGNIIDSKKEVETAQNNATHGDPYANANIAQNGWNRNATNFNTGNMFTHPQNYNAIGGNPPSYGNTYQDLYWQNKFLSGDNGDK